VEKLHHELLRQWLFFVRIPRHALYLTYLVPMIFVNLPFSRYMSSCDYFPITLVHVYQWIDCLPSPIILVEISVPLDPNIANCFYHIAKFATVDVVPIMSDMEKHKERHYQDMVTINTTLSIRKKERRFSLV
jgi:hypothetical protein